MQTRLSTVNGNVRRVRCIPYATWSPGSAAALEDSHRAASVKSKKIVIDSALRVPSPKIVWEAGASVRG